MITNPKAINTKKQTKSFESAGGSSEQAMESEGAKTLPAIPPEIPFVPGVVVAVRLAEPCVDVKGLRRATKENVHVSFVDVKEGQMDVHVRMDDAEAAKQVCYYLCVSL